jgi:sigma-E factor negative regulatory protein RseC
MIEQQGQVIEVSEGCASVRLGGNSGCPACDAGKGCGAGVFGRLLQRKPVVLLLENTINARTGQAVVAGLPESLFLRLVFRLYLFPLLAGLVGAALGHYLSIQYGAGTSLTDGIALVGAVAAAAAAMTWNRKRGREFPRKIAVHLLRLAERAFADQCAGAASNDKQ